MEMTPAATTTSSSRVFQTYSGSPVDARWAQVSPPPRTWAKLSEKPDRNFVERYDRYVGERQEVAFRKVSEDDKRRYVEQRKEVNEFKEKRRNRERDASADQERIRRRVHRIRV